VYNKKPKAGQTTPFTVDLDRQVPSCSKAHRSPFFCVLFVGNLIIYFFKQYLIK